MQRVVRPPGSGLCRDRQFGVERRTDLRGGLRSGCSVVAQRMVEVEPVDQPGQAQSNIAGPAADKRAEVMDKVGMQAFLVDGQQPQRFVRPLGEDIEVEPCRDGVAPEVLRGETSAYDCPEPVAMPLGGGQCSTHFSAIYRQGVAHGGKNECFLAVEIVMHQRRGDTGSAGDLTNGHLQRSGPADLRNGRLNQRRPANGFHADPWHPAALSSNYVLPKRD